MRTVIQRVNSARVEVDKEIIGSIGKGILIFLGIGTKDDYEVADKYIDKILKLRIFSDESGKTNLSLQDVKGEVMVISQFTLYADCRRGNRPDFFNAAGADKARDIYEYFLKNVEARLGGVQSGEFGADMKVTLENDGPFTIVLDEYLFTSKMQGN
jgi:D-tyrosyl-tRNA(Tyr) deacylase